MNDVVGRLRAAGCVFAEDEAALLIEAAAGSVTALADLIARRVAGSPLEPLVGWAEFAGRRIAVGDGVFVPRRRTELLARSALEALDFSARAAADAVFVELCCGAAPIATLVAAERPDVDVHAADIDPNATAVASRNLEPLRGTVSTGDLFDALPERVRGRLDVVAANAPYVPSVAIALMPREAREFEPAVALDGGPDGLAVARRIVASAGSWTSADATLLIETSPQQVPELTALMQAEGWTAEVIRNDDLDATVVVGRRSRP